MSSGSNSRQEDLNFFAKESQMKRSNKLIAGIGASIALGLAAASVYAHPGQMGGGMQGMQGMHGDNKQGMGCSGMHSGKAHGAMGNRGAGMQLMTPEERAALQEKMRNATPEERQKIAAETRAEMEKRAKDRGITLNEPRGPRGPRGSAEGEHKH
jgi:hypothetical protein